jgi:hypothetical protein
MGERRVKVELRRCPTWYYLVRLATSRCDRHSVSSTNILPRLLGLVLGKRRHLRSLIVLFLEILYHGTFRSTRWHSCRMPLRRTRAIHDSRAVRGCRCTNAYLCLQAVRGSHKRVRDVGGPMLGHRGFKERIRINAPVTPVTPSLNPTSFFVHQALYHP